VKLSDIRRAIPPHRKITTNSYSNGEAPKNDLIAGDRRYKGYRTNLQAAEPEADADLNLEAAGEFGGDGPRGKGRMPNQASLSFLHVENRESTDLRRASSCLGLLARNWPVRLPRREQVGNSREPQSTVTERRDEDREKSRRCSHEKNGR